MTASTSNGQGILSGYRIIDLSTVVLGPFATQLLGDLGADVIKIEGPEGDIMRHAGPHVSPGMGPIYLTINRNKRCLTLDLQKSGAKEILRRLVATADALIHNIRAAGIERLGFGYEAVKAIKPDIIYVHAVGFGSQGHYAGRQAYDDLVQAVTGMSTMLPRQDGSSAPRYFPGLIADKTTGLFAANAMLAGLLHKERTGRGQFIEVPMMECMISYTMAENLYGHTFVPPKGPTAYTRSINPERKPYPTKDGYIAIMPYSDANWAAYFELGGRGELIRDPRFATYAARTENITVLYGIIGEIALQKTTDEWLELLARANVPAMRVHTLDSVLGDPQLRETGFVEPRNHPSEGQYLSVGHPVRYSDAPASIRVEPPLQGQHNLEILQELDFAPDQVERFHDDGVFG
ncbi:MAG: CoA transferase [Rhizobiaceae bacterium]